MSTLVDDMLNPFLRYKANTYRRELTNVKQLAESLKEMPKKKARKLIEDAIIKELEEGITEPNDYVQFSDVSKLIGKQHAKELLLMIDSTARDINRVIDVRNGASRDLFDRRGCYVLNLSDCIDRYFGKIRHISFMSEIYEKENSTTRHKGKHTREYLDRIKVLLMELRTIEDRIQVLIGPYVWLVRKKLFPYPDPAKKFTVIFEGQKTEHSYERDWLPI